MRRKSLRIEGFRAKLRPRSIERAVLLRSGSTATSSVKTPVVASSIESPSAVRLGKLTDREFLRSSDRLPIQTRRGARAIRVADLFCGCGAMSVGVEEAARALGRPFVPVFALDSDEDARAIYARNFPSARVSGKDIRELLTARLDAPLKNTERYLRAICGHIDIALAGPPCQGHSDLNNYTRRRDPKNSLYYRVARFAKVVRPRHIVIENVPAVLLDKGRVVTRTKEALGALGYHVDDGVVRLDRLGIPQTRRRHVMIASMTRRVRVTEIARTYRRPAPSVRWAIGDLVSANGDSAMNRAARATEAMTDRMNHLYDHDLYDLPNEFRPDCHRLNNHSYVSVYGRLRWGRPAQTITSGFMCMGQGRFLHPQKRRTLTAREAARLQFIPDFHDFGESLGRTKLAEIIGNAVPPRLSYVFALELLR